MRTPRFTRKVTTSTVNVVKLGFKNGKPIVTDTKEIDIKVNAKTADESKLASSIKAVCGAGYVMGEIVKVVERLYAIPENKFFELAELVSETDVTDGEVNTVEEDK